jgi:hypothetical protein
MDTNMPSHDKVLRLLSDPSAKRWQAAFSWASSICWSGGAGTDGLIPPAALGAVHGTTTTARLLVKYDLWEEVHPHGWRLRNFDVRNPTATVTEAQRDAQRRAARRTNCIRYHGKACGCWKKGDAA